jgi:hypothetical protein
MHGDPARPGAVDVVAAAFMIESQESQPSGQ